MITISGLLMVVADSNFPGSMVLTPTPKGRVSSLRLSDPVLTPNMCNKNDNTLINYYR